MFFQDLLAATPEIGGSRASVTAFDSLGLAWCQATVPIPAGGQIPAPPTSCASDSSDSPTFRLATETRLGVGQVSSKLGNPLLDGPYISVKVIPLTRPGRAIPAGLGAEEAEALADMFFRGKELRPYLPVR